MRVQGGYPKRIDTDWLQCSQSTGAAEGRDVPDGIPDDRVYQNDDDENFDPVDDEEYQPQSGGNTGCHTTMDVTVLLLLYSLVIYKNYVMVNLR